MFGIALAIIKFEFRYVDKLSDGSHPKHKYYLNKIRNSKMTKWSLYFAGTAICCFIVFVLQTDALCTPYDQHSPLYALQFKPCWDSGASALYNSVGKLLFFFGLSCVLISSIVKASKYITSLLSSHLWRILEELTLSAFLVQPLVAAWFLTNRDHDLYISLGFILVTNIASVCIAYIFALPLYLLVQRPLKNFLDLVLFPSRHIFVFQGDVDQGEREEEEEDEGNDSRGCAHATKVETCKLCQRMKEGPQIHSRSNLLDSTIEQPSKLKQGRPEVFSFSNNQQNTSTFSPNQTRNSFFTTSPHPGRHI